MTSQEWKKKIDDERYLAGLKIAMLFFAAAIVFFAGVSAFTEEDTRCEVFSKGRQRFYCEIFEKPIANIIRNIFGLKRSYK